MVTLYSYGNEESRLQLGSGTVHYLCILVLVCAVSTRHGHRRPRNEDEEEPDNLPKDCSEVPRYKDSGVYIIRPTGLHPLIVYCDMTTESGGWIVIQRNSFNSEITWDESWSTYKYGFGNVEKDYWLGLEYLHHITKQKVYQVRFVILDNKDEEKYADYNLFSVEDEANGYRVRLGSYRGTAGDAMSSIQAGTTHDNMKFTSKDKDQDIYSANCAASNGGAWWYAACFASKLNNKNAIYWQGLCNGNCQGSTVMIRPADYCVYL
ncbi:fibrinogen-like protein 1-like protein [Hyla sarda]|uniref:fibrinogen-like protein 1-like protein n=1 Tax=Hyla sarda TaxID=327740 RepID=UPI0024C2DF95|nr:fibrinogen-like protein 1-like protein [Hyla sarda]